MKIVTIIGARPQFVKSAAISRVIADKWKNEISEIIVHTGQHYDRNMSKIFFDELHIPYPDYNLNVGSARHGEQTGKMLTRIESVLSKEQPDYVIVYGDTNSTIAGALAAAKMHIKVVHVEAGLRSFNRAMPEEINRVATDHIADLLCAPTENAMHLLAKENLGNRAIFTGDVMYDSMCFYQKLIAKKPRRMDILPHGKFYLATIHRPSNTDDPEILQNIFDIFSELDYPVLFPIHPRTRKKIDAIAVGKNVILTDPVGYLEMIVLLQRCEKVLTDSGGVQKEAYFLKTPCITLREETEWIETLDNNWNCIVGTDREKIFMHIRRSTFGDQKNFFGDGHAAEKIIASLLKYKGK